MNACGEWASRRNNRLLEAPYRQREYRGDSPRNSTAIYEVSRAYGLGSNRIQPQFIGHGFPQLEGGIGSVECGDYASFPIYGLIAWSHSIRQDDLPPYQDSRDGRIARLAIGHWRNYPHAGYGFDSNVDQRHPGEPALP
jgi:hypothetical protein